MKKYKGKTGALWVAVFLFLEPKNMKQKNSKITQETPKQSFLKAASFSSPVLSPNVFYGTFLGLASFLTVLLYGASANIAKIDTDYTSINPRQIILENKVRRVVAGHPIEQMTEMIAKQDKTTASFLVGIAKKESNWGKRVPRDENGADCFNYWGYRGAGSRGIAMGHGCFGSPEEAIGIVGGRIDTLVHDYRFKTAADMVVWKCGWSCDGHSNQSVKKWIADVAYYKQKID